MNASAPERLLLLAVGNTARGDDGLGWAFAEAAEEQGIFPGEIACRYQLQVEDAEFIRTASAVVFVDAWQHEEAVPFVWEPCAAGGDFSYTTHRLEPGAVLRLCLELYGSAPPAWCLKIRGEQWELGTGLSAAGKRGLIEALEFFSKISDFRA